MKEYVDFKVAITEMYPRNWSRVPKDAQPVPA